MKTALHLHGRDWTRQSACHWKSGDGYVIKRAGSKHWIVYRPSGEKMGYTAHPSLNTAAKACPKPEDK